MTFSTPQQRKFSNPAVELNEKRIRKQLDELPLLNLEVSIGALLDAVLPLNQEPLPYKQRLRLLELYRGSVDQVFETACDSATRSCSSQRADDQQAQRGLSELLRAMADGYKTVLHDGCRAGQLPARHAPLRNALHAAMGQLAHALLNVYRTYDVVPQRLFYELNQLFLFAEQNNVLEFVSGGDDADRGRSIAGIYKRIMLLAAVDPYHFSAGQAAQAYARLAEYAPSCVICGKQACDVPANASLVVHLGTDSRPRSRLRSTFNRDEPSVRVLDVRPVLAALEDMLEQGRRRGREAGLELRLERKLRAAVGACEARRERRAAAHRPARLLCGLETIHELIARAGVQAADDPPDHNVMMIAESPGATLLEAGSHCTIVNESAKGFMLAWETEPEDVCVSTPVALVPQDRDRDKRLVVAIVRWMRRDEDGRLQAGAEHVLGRLSAVWCRMVGVEDPSTPVPCLFVPTDREGGVPATLLAPKELYAQGRLLRLDLDRRSVCVRAGKATEEGPSFDRFEFSPASSADERREPVSEER